MRPFRNTLMENQTVRVTLVHIDSIMPFKATNFSAGFDLYAAESITVPARERMIVSTGLSMEIPYGCYGRIAPRSGHAVKWGIDVGAGVIDSDYRGIIGVLLFNHSDEDFDVAVGERFAQIIIEKILNPFMVNVVEERSIDPQKMVDDLDQEFSMTEDEWKTWKPDGNDEKEHPYLDTPFEPRSEGGFGSTGRF
jgi:dUTP pyrophosphatase